MDESDGEADLIPVELRDAADAANRVRFAPGRCIRIAADDTATAGRIRVARDAAAADESRDVRARVGLPALSHRIGLSTLGRARIDTGDHEQWLDGQPVRRHRIGSLDRSQLDIFDRNRDVIDHWPLYIVSAVPSLARSPSIRTLAREAAAVCAPVALQIAMNELDTKSRMNESGSSALLTNVPVERRAEKRARARLQPFRISAVFVASVSRIARTLGDFAACFRDSRTTAHSAEMDLVLNFCDEHFLDSVWAHILPLRVPVDGLPSSAAASTASASSALLASSSRLLSPTLAAAVKRAWPSASLSGVAQASEGAWTTVSAWPRDDVRRQLLSVRAATSSPIDERSSSCSCNWAST